MKTAEEVTRDVQLRRVTTARRRLLRQHDAFESEVKAAISAGCSIRAISRAADMNFETTRQLVHALLAEDGAE